MDCSVIHPEDPVEDSAPGIVLIDEEMDPFIKGGDGDIPVLTEIGNGACAVQICLKNSQNKAQGIGTVGNQSIRQKGMGMPAGIT